MKFRDEHGNIFNRGLPNTLWGAERLPGVNFMMSPAQMFKITRTFSMRAFKAGILFALVLMIGLASCVGLMAGIGGSDLPKNDGYTPPPRQTYDALQRALDVCINNAPDPTGTIVC